MESKSLLSRLVHPCRMNEGAKAGLVSLLTYRHRKHQMNKNKKQSGFTLIELLIVVAIILIIAAIAVPNLMKAKNSASATQAAASLRTIDTAVQAYASAFPPIGFPATLASLGGTGCSGLSASASSSTAACLLDPTLAATGVKGLYRFTYAHDASVPSAHFAAIAVSSDTTQ